MRRSHSESDLQAARCSANAPGRAERPDDKVEGRAMRRSDSSRSLETPKPVGKESSKLLVAVKQSKALRKNRLVAAVQSSREHSPMLAALMHSSYFSDPRSCRSSASSPEGKSTRSSISSPEGGSTRSNRSSPEDRSTPRTRRSSPICTIDRAPSPLTLSTSAMKTPANGGHDKARVTFLQARKSDGSLTNEGRV